MEGLRDAKQMYALAGRSFEEIIVANIEIAARNGKTTATIPDFSGKPVGFRMRVFGKLQEKSYNIKMENNNLTVDWSKPQ